MTAAEEAELAFLEGDQTLLPIQEKFRDEMGAVTVRPASGVGVDWTANAVTLTSIDEKRGMTDILTLPLSGKSDPYLVESLNRNAAKMGAGTAAERHDATIAAFMEAAAARRKAEAVRAVNATTRHPAGFPDDGNTSSVGSAFPTYPTHDSPLPPGADPKSVKVSVVLGPGFGRLDVVFRDAIIDGPGLILVADLPSSGRPGWVPPPPGDVPVALTLEIEGLPAPIRAFPIGVSYAFQGLVHHVLLIDRPQGD